MCLWNTDAPGGNKVQIWQNLKVPNYDLLCPRGHVMSVKCEQLLYELTVQVLILYDQPNFKYCTLFISGTELQTDRRTDRRTDRQTDDPNTRCPRRTFQAGGIKISMLKHIFKIFVLAVYVHTCKGVKLKICSLNFNSNFN